ncbi:hypothetical protein D0T12_31875 [Actinomadura spongiicola]|uniref:Uncharacterized protein n=1 Tax=Actinomadura spongiicola TaxID=2303421 RepID=A0A372G855_9ACTN|nr:hypothetical protein D0T12_31875 [Actinomadura spongiicola]
MAAQGAGPGADAFADADADADADGFRSCAHAVRHSSAGECACQHGASVLSGAAARRTAAYRRRLWAAALQFLSGYDGVLVIGRVDYLP